MGNRLPARAGLLLLALGAALSPSRQQRPSPAAPGAAAQGGTAATARRGCELVLAQIDTLRAGHLRCYGYARAASPFLEALAAPAASRLSGPTRSPPGPSRRSPRSSRRANPYSESVLRYDGGPKRVDAAFPTLAGMAHSHGDETVGLYGGAFLVGRFGFEHGSDRYTSGRRRFEDNLHGALALIRRPRRQPFFSSSSFLHGYSVHRPHRAPAHRHTRLMPEPPAACAGADFGEDDPRNLQARTCLDAPGGIACARAARRLYPARRRPPRPDLRRPESSGGSPRVP